MKFVAIFCIPADSMKDWMSKVPEAERNEQMTKVMNDWKTWRDENKASIIDEGMPLGKTKRVSKDSIEDMVNDMNYVMTIETDSHDAAAALIQANPHVQQIPTSYVEVMAVSHQGM